MIEQVTNALIANKTINEEDRALYSYGLRQGIIMLAQTASILFVGVLLDMWWQSLLFILAYAPLRLSAGGIHANKQWICFICTILHFVVVIMLIKYIDWTNLAIVLITILSGICIFFLAPIEDKNKPFDEVEKRVYKKRTKITLCIEISIIALLLVFSLNKIAECAAIILGTLGLMVVIGKLKNTILTGLHNH